MLTMYGIKITLNLAKIKQLFTFVKHTHSPAWKVLMMLQIVNVESQYVKQLSGR